MFDNARYDFYTAYGLRFESSIGLPDLAPAEAGGTPDVVVRYERLTAERLDPFFGAAPLLRTPGCDLRVAETAIYFDWENIGRIFVRGGREVLVEPARGVIEEDLLPFLTGPTLTALLHQRGFLVLHASAVEVDGRAVAFLGNKGDGKSTLAAQMQARGHRLVSDDLVPVRRGDAGGIVTHPGYPRIKLYADSVESVGASPADYPFIHRFVDKHSFTCQDSFRHEPLELSAVYVLQTADEIELAPLAAGPAFIEATRHTHVNHHLKALNSLERHFAQGRELVQRTPFFHFRRPHDFARIDEAVARLEAHVRRLPRETPARAGAN